MPKLSERMPDFSLSTERRWLRELAKEVEGHTATLLWWQEKINELHQIAEAQRERLDILESKQQAPVDRHLVEEALAICQDFDAWHGVREIVTEVRDLLRRALEGEQDAQD